MYSIYTYLFTYPFLEVLKTFFKKIGVTGFGRGPTPRPLQGTPLTLTRHAPSFPYGFM